MGLALNRATSAAAGHLLGCARAAADTWDAFWFTPILPHVLAVIRILTGLLFVYTLAVWGIALYDFFGEDGWLPIGAVRSLQMRELPNDFFAKYLSFLPDSSWTYLWYVPDRWLGAAHGAAIVVALLFTVGLWTRVTSIASFIIFVSYVHRVPPALYGLDQILGMLLLYLSVGPSG
ncbi:MAG: hypothetical protein ACRDD1_21200, partial [Planctomycetia bacterium]